MDDRGTAGSECPQAEHIADDGSAHGVGTGETQPADHASMSHCLGCASVHLDNIIMDGME